MCLSLLLSTVILGAPVTVPGPLLQPPARHQHHQHHHTKQSLFIINVLLLLMRYKVKWLVCRGKSTDVLLEWSGSAGGVVIIQVLTP